MTKEKTKIYKNIPSSETGATVSNYTAASHNEYLITSCPEKNRFTLWKVLEGGYEKLGTAGSPLEFAKEIPWNE